MVETSNKKREQEVRRDLQGEARRRIGVRVDWMKGFKEAMNEAINKVGRVTQGPHGPQGGIHATMLNAQEATIDQTIREGQGPIHNIIVVIVVNSLPGNYPHGIRPLLFPGNFLSFGSIL